MPFFLAVEETLAGSRATLADRRRFTGTVMEWWQGHDPGRPGVSTEPSAEHIQHCPFCGSDFDARDLGEVSKHFDHQRAAGSPAAIEIGPHEDAIRWEGTEQSWARVIDFYRDLKTVAVRRHDSTLDVETDEGRKIVRPGGWLVRHADGSVEVYSL